MPDYFDALDRFGRGEARVLLGTQMIAKGLDYPNVRLIGVVNADTALNLPDFRASERTFQLVAQVAGRAGRSAESRAARVIVQTLNPHDPAILAAARHDFPGFARDELRLRAAAGLPPCARMSSKSAAVSLASWAVFRPGFSLPPPARAVPPLLIANLREQRLRAVARLRSRSRICTRAAVRDTSYVP